MFVGLRRCLFADLEWESNMSRLATSLLGVVLSMSAACSSLSSVRVHGGTRSLDGSLNPATKSDTVGAGRAGAGRVHPRSGQGHSASIATRRVCRGAWPDGWIAIAYDEGSGDECPHGTGAGKEYNVATIAQYTTLTAGQTLEVCADQATPHGWQIEYRETTSGEGCPGAGKDGASATRVIRRVY